MRAFSQIPNMLTLGNLLSGVTGILMVTQGNIMAAWWCSLIAAVCDFFDGFLARKLNVQGPMGRELDSLADGVTFGVLPGILVFALAAADLYPAETLNQSLHIAVNCLNPAWLALFIPAFSVYRLAVFNIDTRQTDHFIGVPTPACGLFFCSLPFALAAENNMNGLLSRLVANPAILLSTAIFFSLMLVAPLPLIALKFKNFALAGNQWRYGLILTGIVLPAIFGPVGIPMVILAYILLSISAKIISK
ncbi:MAG: CDP-alcohol phosphatidyltransferase family protein [Bacteroidota bacterium]